MEKHPIDIALQIAAKAHAGQKDRDGHPVILHPITVGMMGHTDDERMAGFLHDVVEDTDYTFEDLLEAGIPVSVVNALKYLTHEKGTPYLEYVQRIIDSDNPLALRVKYNDLQHNYARGKAYPQLQAKHGPALELVKAAVERLSTVEEYEPSSDRQFAVFAGGCFWGVQYYFERQPGVLRTLVGYTGGDAVSASYPSVRTGHTQHVEAVLVEYDAAVVSYTQLCQLFFEIHDPAQTDGVGPDHGPQYRSSIFCASDAEREQAEAVANDLCTRGHEVNTLILPSAPFWVAEELHQHYYEKTGDAPSCHRRVRKFE